MRADIVPGNKFPDYELTDTDKGRHHLSERLRGPFQGLQQTPTREEGHVVTGHLRPRAAFALIAWKRGSSFLQGAHQDAQKLRATTEPRRSARRSALPSRRVSVTSGAGRPTRPPI